MKIKSLFLVLLALFFTGFLKAQTLQTGFSIKGIVVDSATQKTLDYVTVALKQAEKPFKSALTNDKGAFVFENLPSGKYNIALVSVGYSSKTIPVDLDSLKRHVDLGKIEISPSNTTLKEVAVVADRPLIKQEVDRIAFDVQADPESKVNNVLDMLRKVPLISLDADDNIKLKGSGNYKVLINGRPSSLVARDPKEVFKSMPAANIQKIEVITTPPAKYDSEGLAGIINIITNKKIDAGYNGSLTYRQGFPAGGPGLNSSLTVKEGKLGLSGYGGVSINNSPGTISKASRITTGALPSNLIQDGNNQYSNQWSYMSSELSYEIDSLNLITGEMGFNDGRGKNTSSQLTTIYDAQDAIMNRHRLQNASKGKYGGWDVGLNYQLGFKRKKEQLLTFSYKYNGWGNTSDDQLDISERINYNDPNYRQRNRGESIEQTIQVDYVHPVKKLNIEGGVKGILRNNKSDFGFSQFDAASNAFIEDPTRTNKFNNHQDIIGIYNSYQYNLKNWGFKAGIRVEETLIRADFESNASTLDKDYFNFIPSVSVKRTLPKMSSLNFGFTQRIQRPGIWQLNPYVNRMPNFEDSGNPNLRPVLNNNFDLSYSKFKKGSINLGLNYSFANNTIQYVSTFNPATNITSSNYFNIGKDRKLGSNFNLSYPVTTKFNVNMSGNLYYVWIEGNVGSQLLKNEGMQGYMYGSASYRFDKGWRAGLSFSFNSPWMTLQGKSNAYKYMSASLNKDIIKNKLSFSSSVSNPFQKFRSWKNTSEGANFVQTNDDQNYYRRFNMSLNYRFGKLKDQIKKNKRGINNDDVKGGGSGGNQ
ncbi:MAG TPA: outer membrane beta-barrel family protein [Daejeonella sp.]|nr:outer membrane beta-barrel family protein [Daejeonella sp.]